MFGQKSTRQIDLHLPTGWNRCTTEELEAIAAAIIQEQQRVDRYHPFDWSRVKLNIVLSINGITVLRDNDISKGDESEWLVRRPQDKEPWPITVGQLMALTERLTWIDDEKASKVIFQFPYPELELVHGSGFMVQGSGFKDFREVIHAKHPQEDAEFEARPYWQVFQHRYGFQPNLSILDLLFCMGPESVFYL